MYGSIFPSFGTNCAQDVLLVKIWISPVICHYTTTMVSKPMSCFQVGMSAQPNTRAGDQSRISSHRDKSFLSYTKWFSKSVRHRSEVVWQVCITGGKKTAVYWLRYADDVNTGVWQKSPSKHYYKQIIMVAYVQ